MREHRRRADEAPALSEPWTMGDLRLHWRSIVGDFLAHICRPSHISPGPRILYIKAVSDAWCDELTNLRDALEPRLPNVDGVQLRNYFVTLDERLHPNAWRVATQEEIDEDPPETWQA